MMSNSQIFSVIGHDIVLTACILLVFTVIEPVLKKLLVHYKLQCNITPRYREQFITR